PICQPFDSVICHEYAHIETDECGACEFFTRGSKLVCTRGPAGKLDLREVEAALLLQHGVHSHKARVISVTEATEFGTVYKPNEISTIAEFAPGRGMML